MAGLRYFLPSPRLLSASGALFSHCPGAGPLALLREAAATGLLLFGSHPACSL